MPDLTVSNDIDTFLASNNKSSAITNLGAQEYNGNLLGLKNSINLLASSTAIPVSAILIGDSFAATGSLFNFGFVTRVVGSYRTGALTGGGDSGVTTVSDYTKSPSGSYSSIASGGNLTAAHLQTGLQGLASTAYYTLFTGTGTAQIQSKKGAGAWTNVGSPIDTSLITSVSIGSLALADTSSNYAVRVTATGGTVNGWIGQGLDGPGLTTMDFAIAGQAVEQSATVTETIWKAMVTGYKASGGCQIIMSAFADYRFTTVATSAWPTKGTQTWGTSGPAQTLHNWSRTANPSVDWLIISPHQVDTSISEAADALVDAAFTAIGIGSNLNIRTLDGSRAQREFAVYNSSAFCDCSYITDYAKGNAEGLYGDTIHFNAEGQDYKRSHLFAQTNLGWILGASQSFPAIRMGPVLLTSSNARSSVSSLIAYTGSSTNTVLAGITGSNLRAGDAINPEQAGMEFGWVSTNYGRIRSYNAGGSNSNGLDITYNGAGISLRPSVTASSQNGTTALPWETTVTQGLVLAPIAQTATTAAVSTVYTTTALTTTAPAQAITLANGTVGQIKTIMHVASSGSGTAVLTPTTKTGFTTITFTNVGDTATLQYFTTQGWMIIAIRGAVAA